MAMDAQTAWLTSKEAAALLRVHPKHIYRLLARGLPAERVGGQWRFTAAELRAWAQRGRADQLASSAGSNRQQIATSHARMVACTGDVAVECLLAEVNQRQPASLGALVGDLRPALPLLQSGEVLAVAWMGEWTQPSAIRLARLHIGHEAVGLAGCPGGEAPQPGQLAKRKLRLAGWAPGCDLRRVADGVLSREGIDPARAHKAHLLATTHQQLVSMLLQGKADAAFTTEAWARRCGLPFVALASKPIGLFVAVSALADPCVIQCWEALQSAAWRGATELAGGFDPSDAGAIQYLATPAPRPAARHAGGPAGHAVILRGSGEDASAAVRQVVRELRRRGLRVAGFVQLPRRRRSRVEGYEVERLADGTRVELATLAPGARGPRFAFRSEAFTSVLRWVERDAAEADILVIDAAGSLESRGQGHFDALAAALQSSRVCLLCARTEHLAATLQRLGLRDRPFARLDHDRCREPSTRRLFVDALAGAVEKSHSFHGVAHEN